jgi:hypothetical protein
MIVVLVTWLMLLLVCSSGLYAMIALPENSGLLRSR